MKKSRTATQVLRIDSFNHARVCLRARMRARMMDACMCARVHVRVCVRVFVDARTYLHMYTNKTTIA